MPGISRGITSPTVLGLMMFGLLFGVVLLQAEVGAFAKAVRGHTSSTFCFSSRSGTHSCFCIFSRSSSHPQRHTLARARAAPEQSTMHEHGTGVKRKKGTDVMSCGDVMLCGDTHRRRS